MGQVPEAPGAILGACYGLTAGIVVGYWDVLTGQARVSFQWIGPISLFTTLAAGCIFSLVPLKGRPPIVAWLFGGAAVALLAFAVWRISALHG